MYHRKSIDKPATEKKCVSFQLQILVFACYVILHLFMFVVSSVCGFISRFSNDLVKHCSCRLAFDLDSCVFGAPAQLSVTGLSCI